ncbi:MAG: glutamine-hydrolyzing GMP synthase [Ardenticatenales bacterium]
MDHPPTDTIAVIDYGGQTAQLIARRIREQGVYCELVPWNAPPERIAALNPKGFVLSGGPDSVYDPGAPTLQPMILDSGLPVLGICYGMQLLAHDLGGAVAASAHSEYGSAEVDLDGGVALFNDLPEHIKAWMNHGDRVESLPPGFRSLGHTSNSPYAIMGDVEKGYYAVQFHPEVAHTPLGGKLLRNFVRGVCGCAGDWTATHFVATTMAELKARIGNDRVLVALSGGVDSSVMAALIHRAVGERMMALFIDHGLLREGERADVEQLCRDLEIPCRTVDASARFLGALADVEDPETKRKIIGETFIRVFEAEAAAVGEFRFLAQGTLYPDVIESASTSDTAAAHKIKTHHNVGGLPDDIEFEIVEPLRFLFKDEVRAVGRELGLPDRTVMRQPFPGPGLAVRHLGAVTQDGLGLLRAADAIVRHEIEAAAPTLGDEMPWQYFAVLTPVRSVGVMGDQRTYGRMVAVRAVTSSDGMTADWAKLPHALLGRIATRIVNEVKGINRVVYDITSKPPGTIEWL